MVYTAQLIEELISTVNDNEDLSVSCTAIKGYDDANITRPIDRIYLSFSCNEEKITYFDEESEYCQKVSVDICINTFVPLSFSVISARTAIERILCYLNDSYVDQLSGYTIGETDYDDDINAYKIASHLYFEYDVCAGDDTLESGLNSSSTFFCQSHVNDTDLHLTSAMTSRIENPFVVGTYYGTGYSVYNTITLGFRPRALFIYADSIPLCNVTSSRIDSYFAMATQLGTSQGITLNSTGFSVRQNSSNSTDSAIALINESDVTYHYIAFI